MIFMIVFIGVPTIYAMWFGAPWVPTPIEAVRKMLKEAKIKKGQKVYDLGCGDGRFVIEAAKQGAKGIGFEISPLIWLLAITRNTLNGLPAKILLKSFWNRDLSDADVICLYLLPKSMPSLVKKFKKELKKGTLIVSYAFQVKGLELIKKIEKDRKKNICPIWIYKI
jgi:ribosomal protein L11 methylase PrmA